MVNGVGEIFRDASRRPWVAENVASPAGFFNGGCYCGQEESCQEGCPEEGRQEGQEGFEEGSRR